MARRKGRRTSNGRCTCKIGTDGRKHCFMKTKKGIKGCKTR